MTTTASTGDTPRVRARRALGLAVGMVAPDAIVLENGALRLGHSRERLGRKALRRLERRLERRAGIVDDDRLIAEAVAFVGAEVDRARGGNAVDGATGGLDALLDLPGLPARQRSEGNALLRDLLDGNRLETDADLRRLTRARARQESSGHPATADLVAETNALIHEAERLTTPAPAALRNQSSPRPGVGGRNNAPGNGIARAVHRLVGKLRSNDQARRTERDRRAAAHYAEFQQLSLEWRDTRDAQGARPLADVESDLAAVAAAIRRDGHPAPRLPWAGLQVAVPAALLTPVSTPEQRFGARVRRQVADLDAAAANHSHRAAVRTASAQAALDEAAELFESAADQAKLQDAAAGERARRLRNRGVAYLRIAERHEQIAAACTIAAERARTAAEAAQALTTGGDADIARRAIQAYERADAATVPAKDLQHNGLPSGRLPHLSALCAELNEALGEPGRFTPDALHRTLRGESRRLLSPDGLVLTPDNDPRAGVRGVRQLHLVLDPGELREVLNSPVKIDEAQVGQVVQGGFSFATAASRDVNVAAGASLATLSHALPDASQLRAAAMFVSPGAELAQGRDRTVSGGATDFAQPGAVEALRGEFLRYRADRPRWIWRIRESATADWSEPNVVDTGSDRDATALVLGFVHTYTVPPPGDTTSLDALGLDAERRPTMPEHMATRVDGLHDLCDRTVAELRRTLGALDRVGHDRVRSLIVEDGMIRLDQTSRPGGVWRLITSDGRPVAWAQLETTVQRESAELTSDSSPDHKLEIWRVSNTGASGSQTFSSNRALGAGLASSLQDLGSTTADLGPALRAGRNTSRDDTASTGDQGTRWSTQRVAPTVGVKVQLRHRVTIHRLDRAGSFTVTGDGDAYLRMAERDAFRYGLPAPSEVLIRDGEGAVQRRADGQLLLRGDPVPTDVPLRLPIWLGNDPAQLRGAGPAMIRELSGADQALRSFLDHLSQQGMIPALDEHGLPLPEDLAGKDPAVVLSRTENWQRACEQIARHRLEAGYDHAAQDRLTFQLTQHRTGGPPRVRSYRITLEQHFDRATPIGLANYDAVVNVDFGVSSSGRTTTQARSLPWSARLGLSDAPAAGQAGTAPTLGTAISRSSRGRSLGSWSSRGAYRMAVAESASRVAVFDIPHTIRITELTADGAVPVASSEGSAQVWLDSDFCRDATESTVAVRGPVEPGLLQTATIHQIDVRDPIDQLTAAVPALGHHNSAALHHLNAFLAPRNLMTHPELLTTEYRTSLAVGPVPAGPLSELRQRALTPQPGTLALTTRIENLRYVGSGPVTLSELNVTFATTGTTASRSAATTAGFSAGYGLVSADGPSYDVSHGSARTTSTSSSTTVSKTSGVERTLIRDGQHYQFWGDLVLEARLRLGTAHDVPLDNGAVVLTLPESEALLSYGRGALDLPLHQVSDAVERLLNGNLELPRRTTTALLLRYQIDKQGATDSLAARHTEEVIVTALQKTFGFAKKSAPALDAVLRSAEDLAQLRVRTQLPRHYDRTMGAAQIDTAAFRDSDGNGTDLFREIRAAVADHSRRALNDPVLIDALRGNFAEPRWRNQMDNMLDPGGFVDELPVRGGAGSRKLKLRVRLRFTGGPTTDLGGTQDITGNGFGLVQLWTFRERGRSVSRSTSYGTSLNGTATNGIPVGVGIGAELSTSTTASSSEINTRITAGLALKTARIERDCRVEIEVEDSAEPGVTTRRVVTGRLTLAVPASVLDSAPPQLGPEDHRTVVLPDRYLPEATLPYLTGTAEDNTLFAAACARLRRRDLLTPEGVRMHATTLESQLGAANRLTEFQEIAGESGHELVPLPVPGKPTKVVVVRVRAEISGLELVSDPDPDSAIQLGENTRAINVSQLTARSNRLLPGSRTVSSGTPGGELSTSLSRSGRVSQQDTGTVGARHETGVYESSQFVTVKVRVDYHLDFERLRLGRRLRPKVERSDTVRRAAVGEGYITMYRHEYARMQEQMESGRTAGPGPADGPTVQVTVDADERHPYQPLINALERARREDVDVRLVIREPNGRRTTVVARPDGTMTGRNDGGFAAAFATLHPRLALLAEGRVDLRALHSAQTSQRFTSVVVDALQQQGIPAAALTAMDARTSGPRSSATPAYRSRNSHQATGTAIE